MTATHSYSIAVQAVALNSLLQSQYGLLQYGGHSYPPNRILFHNLVLDHLANATEDGVASALACYRDSSQEEKTLPLVGRLAEALYAAQADIRRLRETFQHEQERSMDVSRFGYKLAVEEYERPAPTTNDSAARMEFVLKQAKRGPTSQQQPPVQQSQSQAQRQGGGGSGYWQARRQRLKAEKAKGGSGKAPFVGYTGTKANKKKS